MCPLSATMQLFLVLFSLILICHHAIASAQGWKLSVEPEATIIMYETQYINFNLTGPDDAASELYLQVKTQNDDIATPETKTVSIKNEGTSDKWFGIGNFSVTGTFLGRTKIYLDVTDRLSTLLTHEAVDVRVIRKKRVIDTVFTSTVATLVSIIYINFGCALNWKELITNLKRPIGPAIGFVGQFLFMPLISFGLGKLLFPDNPEMQLGLFFTGVSPGGGASNVWVAVLDGDIDLSITMTSISTFGSFGMMPLWLFTLGGVIFDQGNMEVPYSQISTYAIALVVPLLIGYLIQRFLKKVARFFVRILKVFSSLLIVFIVVFAIVSNLYLFKIFSWQIVVGGVGLPWLGYMTAFLLAKAFKRPSREALTIAVETGIQNTGIAIFLLRFALPQPEADLTTVVPVYVATMTPIPLFMLFFYKLLRKRFSGKMEKTYLLSGNDQLKETNVDTSSEINTGNTTLVTIS